MHRVGQRDALHDQGVFFLELVPEAEDFHLAKPGKLPAEVLDVDARPPVHVGRIFVGQK
jgi:hypothetical protein